MCLSKSPNKHNRLFGKAIPLNESLSELIEKGTIGPHGDIKERNKKLVDEFGWEKQDALKLWCFGPDNVKTNFLFLIFLYKGRSKYPC